MSDLLQRLSVRELRLLLIGVAAIVVAGLAFGLLVPRAKAMIAAQDAVEVLEAASQNDSELSQLLADENTTLQELRHRLYGDMANLPVRQVEAYIIGRLQEVSWASDVELVSVEPAMGEQVQVFQELLFNVELVGNYHDLYRWLWDVRNELGYVVVKEYSLTRHDDIDDEPALSARLSLASYRTIQ